MRMDDAVSGSLAVSGSASASAPTSAPTSVAAPRTPAADALDERYGRTPGRQRRKRRGAIAAAITAAVVIGAWVVWGGLDGTTTAVDSQSTAHKVLNDRQLSMTWQVTMTPGSRAKCALQAQNTVHATVGWKIVDVPPSERRTQSFTGIVNTTDLAVTGLIYRCWLA